MRKVQQATLAQGIRGPDGTQDWLHGRLNWKAVPPRLRPAGHVLFATRFTRGSVLATGAIPVATGLVNSPSRGSFSSFLGAVPAGWGCTQPEEGLWVRI